MSEATTNDAVRAPKPHSEPRVTVVALLSVLVPGLGHVHLGRARRGITLFLITCCAACLAAPLATAIPAPPVNVIVPLALVLAAFGYTLLEAIVLALRARSDPPESLGPGGLACVGLIIAVNAVLLGAFIAYKAVLYEPFLIPSGSMEDTMIPGDHVVADKLCYGLRVPLLGWQLASSVPERGDVVIYCPPDRPGRLFSHRLVALPGDLVEVADHRLVLNHNPVDEPYITIKPSPTSTSPRGESFGPTIVPEGMAFVLGDNRANSLDSRFTGFIPLESIRGRVELVYWSRPPAGRSSARDAPPRPVNWQRIGRRVR